MLCYILTHSKTCRKARHRWHMYVKLINAIRHLQIVTYTKNYLPLLLLILLAVFRKCLFFLFFFF